MRPIVDFSTKVKNLHCTVAVDTEFQPRTNKPSIPITVQVDNRIYEHPTLKLNKIQSWKCQTVFVDHLGLASSRPLKSGEKIERKIKIRILFYFSFSDISLLFTDYQNMGRFLAHQCRQENIVRIRKKFQKSLNTKMVLTNHDGIERLLYIQPYDLSGLLGKISLARLMETLEMDTAEKEIFTSEEKGRMLKMYKTRHDEFREYAQNDALVLHEIERYHTVLWQSVSQDLQIPEIVPSQTIGSNTAKISRALIVKILFGRNTSGETNFKSTYGELKESGKPKKTTTWRCIAKLIEEATALDLLTRSPKRTAQYLALIDGGRCRNERPIETTISGTLADIDISGCYGRGLVNQSYPIGRPVIYDFEKDDCNNLDKDPRPTLGKFFKSKEGDELIDGLWYARISTKKTLSFDQDLLLSKIEPSFIRESKTFPHEDDFETPALHSEFLMLTRELHHATLTSDLLEVIRAVCSNKEKNDFFQKVVIDAIIFYPKSMQVESVEELCEKERNPARQKFFSDDYVETRVDGRSRHWTTIGFADGWIDKLLNMRKEYPKGTAHNALLKLIINATYGVNCSEYFDLNNVVVASNITARARALAWMMAKALGCYQTITDGGLFDLNNVMWYDDKSKPSLETLSNIHQKHMLLHTIQYQIKTKPLGVSKWTVSGKKLFHGESCADTQLIDNLAWAHVKGFFKEGNIAILRENQFSFETKDVYVQAAFQSQANYRFVKSDGKVEIKARGYELKKVLYYNKDCTQPYEGIPPIADCLKRIADGDNMKPYPALYKTNPLKINRWLKIPRNDTDRQKLLPGDTVSIKTHLRPISVPSIKFQTYQQYQAWQKKNEKLKIHTEMGYEQLFMDEDMNYSYQDVVNTIQAKVERGVKSPKTLINEQKMFSKTP